MLVHTMFIPLAIWWHLLTYSIVNSCPFTNPGPLEAYYAAADAFHRDLQQEFISDDTADATLATKHTLLSLHEEDRARLRGRPTRTLVVRNPFLHADARRSVFDVSLRLLS